jgi:Zn-dependent protease with chaperone function
VWVRQAVQTTFGAIGSLALVAFFVLIWAAQLRSCVASVGTETDSAVSPRSPDLKNDVESRLVWQLAGAWEASGGTLESLSAWIVDDSAINAASVGGGTFVLWRGLEQLTDDDLDAVFAHEIAHDQLQHSRKIADVADVTNFIGEALGTASGSGDQATSTLKRWSGKFVVPRYSRQQELEADERAVSLLGALDYEDPAASMCLAFGRLRMAVGEAGGGFFDDHPALTERIAAIRQRHPSVAVARDCK